MDVPTLVKSITVFLLVAVTLGLDGSDNLLARIGMEDNYALLFGLALLFTLLLASRNVYVIGTVAILSLIANMPADFSLNFGVDRDYYAGAMVALILQPVLTRLID